MKTKAPLRSDEGASRAELAGTEKIRNNRDEIKMEPYHYTECGLDNVWIANGFSRKKFGAHDCAVMVHDQKGLWDVIARQIIDQDSRIVGQQLRFLRSMLDWTQTELGKRLGYNDGQRVAAWEKAAHKPVPVIADAFVRGVYREKIGEAPELTALSKRLQEIGDMVSAPRLVLEEGPAGGWTLKPDFQQLELA